MWRIYIVDGHVFIRDGLKLLLAGHGDLSVVGTATRGDGAME
ncbi:MAG: response regulator transcription factor ['Candidatus Kapabacteria' thiocyanatum]|nr:response regulator transcription factor ['Candidatus Kapabacteria' thiocyanatum]